MVRTFGKQQGRHVEGVHQRTAVGGVGKQVSGIVVDDVVSADVVSTTQEVEQLLLRGFVEGGAVVPQCSDVVYFPVFYSDFHIDNGVAWGFIGWRHILLAGDFVGVSGVFPSHEPAPYRHCFFL